MRVLALLLACLFTVSCGAGERDTEPLRDGTPALWKATDEDGRAVWLFGSIHSLPPGTRWRSRALGEAIAQADGLVLEVLGLDEPSDIQAVFTRLARTPGQPPLNERLPGELVRGAEQLADEADMSRSDLAAMESWAVAISFASIAAREVRASQAAGVERRLMDAFEGRPVVGLETAEQQLSYFDRLAEDDQRAMLAAVVSDADDPRASYYSLLDTWISGDVAQIAHVTRTGLLARETVRETVLLARNNDWAEKIDDLVKQGRSPLVAVGAAHLAGPGSVQELLMQRGYRIVRIN